MRELQWYLETFLDYPFPPETNHAERVLDSLKRWGEQAFENLFGGRAAGRMFDAATSEDYARLHLQISSDDPRILAWPWEALRDPELGPLAHTCQIERRLNKLVVTPRMHGIHHSIVERETNSNWSSGLTVWDWLHGTLRNDIPQEEITIGVEGYEDPRDVTLPRVLAMPFGFLSGSGLKAQGSGPASRPVRPNVSRA